MRRRATWLVVLLVAGAPAFAGASSPSEARLHDARRALEARPSAAAWTRLGVAHAQRARETADPAHYARAEAAASRALALEPDSRAARRLAAWALLGQHRFEAALAASRALARDTPGDVRSLGLVADALVELGRYDEAVEAVQAMLDRSPGGVPGLTRAAHLRELRGDLAGALELLATALRNTPAREPEEQAWILAELSRLERGAGRPARALELADAALATAADAPHALAERARSLRALGRREEAVAAFRRRYERAPHPENLYELAVAVDEGGRDAGPLFAAFTTAAEAESASADNCNRDLVLYWAERAGRTDAALQLAEREAARRRDLATLEAHAWALHRAGRSREAWTVISAPLDRGWARAETLRRAAPIAEAAGEPERARVLRKRALAAPPSPTEPIRRTAD